MKSNFETSLEYIHLAKDILTDTSTSINYDIYEPTPLAPSQIVMSSGSTGKKAKYFAITRYTRKC